MSENEKTEKGVTRVNRSAARLAAVQALYELEMSGASPDTVLLEFVRHRWESGEGEKLAEPDKSLFLKIVRGVCAEKAHLSGVLDKALTGDWSTERLEVVLRVVLFAGLYELKNLMDVPPRVVINEYMEVAKAFFDSGEVSMVNGVLDKMAHVLREGEMSSRAGRDAHEEG